MKELKFTHKLPTKPGFYWWTNFGEHTPVVLEVRKYAGTDKLFASNEEFSFEVTKAVFEKDEELKTDGHYYGEEMWCEIPVPTMDGKKISADYY